MRRHRHHLLVSLCLLLMFACVDQDDTASDSSATAGGSIQDEEAWVAEILQHREEIDENLRNSKTSPMAGTQYLKSEPGDRFYLTRQGKTFALSATAVPDDLLSVAKDEGTWQWVDLGREEVVCRVGDEIMATSGALEERAIFELEDLTLSFYGSDDRVTFIVFDADREEMTSFDRLLYFPPDRTFAVDAQLAVLPEPEEIVMLTSRDLKKTFYRYAKIEFQVDDVDQELTAFKYELTGEGSKALFIPFRDATTGRETYGAGRFLEIEEPQEVSFVLDFNRAFNPLCNYSPAYNCAIPPRENHLKEAIRAGEKTYPH